MKNLLKVLYAVTAYLVGLGGLAYFILFQGPVALLPHHIDADPSSGGVTAWLIDLALVLGFGLQHSVMARPAFKRAWTRVVPQELERATYVLVSGIFMMAFALLWQPLGGQLWDVDSSLARNLLTAGCAAGFLFSVAATFMLDHFRLFGLKQLYDHLRDEPLAAPKLEQVLFYRFVRHPIQTGMLVCLWCTPTMSGTHLMLAASLTVYIFIGLYFEERELVRSLGPAYEAYRRRVGMLLPRPMLGATPEMPVAPESQRLG